MNEEAQEELQEARETYIGRLFSVSGSAAFFIGSAIATAVAYQTYNRLSQKTTV